MIGQLKEKFGYTHKYILWGQAWVLFLLEMADAPRYVRGKPPTEIETITSVADAANMFGNYR